MAEVTAERQVPSAERLPGWASLGKVLEEPMNTSEMLDYAGLSGWNLRMEPLSYPYPFHAPQNIVVRDSAEGPIILGEVGQRYRIMSNEAAFSFGDSLLDSGEWVAAGSFAHDTKVFGSLRLNDPTTVGDETVEHYLMIATAHDGTMSISASITPIIPSCENTLNLAIRTAVQSYKFRHTESAAGRAMEARQALGLATTYVSEWDKAMQELIATEVSNMTFDAMIREAYKPKDTKSGQTRFDKAYDAIWENWANLPDSSYGNKFGALNALNEFHMWGSRGNGDNAAENIAATRSGFNPVWNSRNNQLYAMVEAW